MDYAIALSLCTVEIFLVGMYFKKLNIFSNDYSESADEYPEILILNNNKYFYIVMFIIAVSLLGSAIMLVNSVSNLFNLAKLLILIGILAAAAVVDMKRMIIPNLLIIVGVFVRVMIYIAEFLFYNELFVHQLISDLIGFGIGFGILFLTSVVTRGALGFGDVKLFGVIGMMSGAICTYSTLLFCLITSTVVSVVLMIIKKKKKKDSIPFGPFIFIGNLIAIILSCY